MPPRFRFETPDGRTFDVQGQLTNKHDTSALVAKRARLGSLRSG